MFAVELLTHTVRLLDDEVPTVVEGTVHLSRLITLEKGIYKRRTNKVCCCKDDMALALDLDWITWPMRSSPARLEVGSGKTQGDIPLVKK